MVSDNTITITITQAIAMTITITIIMIITITITMIIIMRCYKSSVSVQHISKESSESHKAIL